jgi:hypothetical protein
MKGPEHLAIITGCAYSGRGRLGLFAEKQRCQHPLGIYLWVSESLLYATSSSSAEKRYRRVGLQK